MLRRLITLFVLLSGLAAIGAPVQARAADMSGIGLVASTELRSDCVKKQGQRNSESRRSTAEKGSAKPPCRKASPIVFFPPVMLKADRSRE